jgi:F420-dependent oxidoreductase-like protein
MRVGLNIGYAPPGINPVALVELAQEAERLGYSSAWAAEAWGTDCVTVLSWLAATTTRLKVGAGIMQMPARTPAATAMTAATLDLMSGGRFLLGLGTSGPQVVEGWHGQPWGAPLTRTREYVEIVRSALRRDTLEHHGREYNIPYSGPGATGLGKPLKLMARPLRADVPIYLAAISPKAVAQTFAIADGWLPMFLSPEKWRGALGVAGVPAGFEIAPTVTVVVGDDLAACRDVVRAQLALYVGGMGARGQNFYNALVRRYGYEAEAATIQDLYLAGKHREAAAAVPDALVDEVALVGSKERIADRLDVWCESGATELLCATTQPEALRLMAELLA